MSFFNRAHEAIELGRTVFNKGTINQWDEAVAKRFTKIHGGDAINKIGSAIMSPLAVAGGISRGEGVGNTLKAVYGGLENPNLSNIAGSAFTVGVGTSVVGGLTHDSAGNPDIAGIPFI